MRMRSERNRNGGQSSGSGAGTALSAGRPPPFLIAIAMHPGDRDGAAAPCALGKEHKGVTGRRECARSLHGRQGGREATKHAPLWWLLAAALWWRWLCPRQFCKVQRGVCGLNTEL